MARDTLTDWQGSARGQGGGVQSALEGRARLLAANVNEGVWLVTAGTGLRLAVGGWRSIVYVWVWIAEMPPVAPTPRNFTVVVVTVPGVLGRANGPVYSWVGGVGGAPAAGTTGFEPSVV
jgi:hypothetical protein